MRRLEAHMGDLELLLAKIRQIQQRCQESGDTAQVTLELGHSPKLFCTRVTSLGRGRPDSSHKG